MFTKQHYEVIANIFKETCPPVLPRKYEEERMYDQWVKDLHAIEKLLIADSVNFDLTKFRRVVYANT